MLLIDGFSAWQKYRDQVDGDGEWIGLLRGAGSSLTAVAKASTAARPCCWLSCQVKLLACSAAALPTTIAYPPAAMSTAPAPKARLASLDQFRGYTVVGMVFVNFVGAYVAIPLILKHRNTYCKLRRHDHAAILLCGRLRLSAGLWPPRVERGTVLGVWACS